MDVRNYKSYDQLKDGRRVLIRAIRATDKEALQIGLHHLSKNSAYMRFHGTKRELNKSELSYLTELDFEGHVAIGVIIEEHHALHPIAVGRYVIFRDEPFRAADIALTVEDKYQSLGIGSILLKHLVYIARENDVASLEADVMSDNERMLHIIYHSDLPYIKNQTDGETHISITLDTKGQ